MQFVSQLDANWAFYIVLIFLQLLKGIWPRKQSLGFFLKTFLLGHRYLNNLSFWNKITTLVILFLSGTKVLFDYNLNCKRIFVNAIQIGLSCRSMCEFFDLLSGLSSFLRTNTGWCWCSCASWGHWRSQSYCSRIQASKNIGTNQQRCWYSSSGRVLSLPSLSFLQSHIQSRGLGFYVNWYTTFSPLDYSLYGLVVSYMCIKLQMLDSIPTVKTALIQGFRSCVIFCLKDVMPWIPCLCLFYICIMTSSKLGSWQYWDQFLPKWIYKLYLRSDFIILAGFYICTKIIVTPKT